MLLSKLIQPELLPQLASQPAVAECPWPPQFQPAQVHLHAIQRVGGDLPVVGEQTHTGVALCVFIEHIQRLAPRSLLLAVDLTQI
jgi:hypothetical protein